MTSAISVGRDHVIRKELELLINLVKYLNLTIKMWNSQNFLLRNRDTSNYNENCTCSNFTFHRLL